MILPDHEIEAIAVAGAIDPYEYDQLQPSSYDVRLGNTFRVFSTNHSVRAVDPQDAEQLASLTTLVERADGEEMIIHPRESMLATTNEVIRVPDDLVCRLEGKSSLGRIFLMIHATAGYIDPGFDGTITLEMSNLLDTPTIIRPGMLIAQISFARMTSAARTPYKGRYQGDREATPSRYAE